MEENQITTPKITLPPALKAIFSHLKRYSNPLAPATPDEEVLQINKLTGTAGTFYEKIRYLLDYKDEHMVERSAIARILKRKIVIEGVSDVGMPILRELISGGYLPNKTIPERVSLDVQKIVDRYLSLKGATDNSPGAGGMIITLAANEISRLLFPVIAEEAVTEAYYQTMCQQIHTTRDLKPEEFGVAIYIACRQGLLQEDTDSTAYALWLRFSGWNSDLAQKEIENLGRNFAAIQIHIKKALKDPLSSEIGPKIKNNSIYFRVVRELVRTYGAETETVIENETHLAESIRSILANHYKKENVKTQNSAVRAITYIFCTKIVVALLLEIPYELYVIGAISYFPLAANVIFHPIILFFMTRVDPLGEKNTARILEGLAETLRGNPKPIVIKKPASDALSIIFSALYLVLFLVSFSLLIFILVELHFNIASILLFLLFLTLVSYFGLRIRHNGQRWKVKSDEEKLSAILWNVFTLPIVRAGRWLSRTFSAINVFVFFMDFLVEAPFKLFLGIADAFTSFLREKQEETL